MVACRRSPVLARTTPSVVNQLLLFPDERIDAEPGVFEMTGDRARHVREVLRARPGDVLRVGLLDGDAGSGEVVACGPSSVRVACTFREESPASAIDLVLAVPRARSLKKVLCGVAGAFGVRRLVLLRSWRVHKPYLSADVLTPEVYRPLLHEGMMQGRVTREPRVEVAPEFRPFVEDRAPVLFRDARKLVAHPAGDVDLADVRLSSHDPVVIAVGPEGGWLPYEIDRFVSVGFEVVSSGERTLRVEVACAALLAQVELLRRQGAR